MLIMSSCCECSTTPPGPCVYTDDFSVRNLGWEEANTSGGTEVAYTLDAASGTMNATGDGSLTLTTTGEFTSIYVAAELIDNGAQVESGVTVRRADSDENISLVRVWGTTDAYELRQGTTVLEAFTSTSDSTPIVKLEIADAASGTTDIKCYVDGVLAHTEPGFVFAVPDDLNLGIICEGGGKWGLIEMSPCPVGGGCDILVDCTNITHPLTWVLETGEINGDPFELPGEDKHESPCDVLPGTHYLVNNTRVGTVYCNPDDLTDCWWTGPQLFRDPSYIPACAWSTVSPWKITSPFAGTIPDGMLPINQGACSYSDPNNPQTSPITCSDGSYGVLGGRFNSQSAPLWLLSATTRENETTNGPLLQTKLSLGGAVWTGSISNEPTNGVVYESQWYDLGHDFTIGDIVLNIVPDSDLGCSFPATVTIKPNGNETLAAIAAGCESQCDDPLDPNKLYQLLADDGTKMGCSTNEAIFNYETFSWEWHWLMFVDDYAHGYGGCASPNSLSYSAALTCYEKNEGEGKRWWLDLTGDITGSVRWDVLGQGAGGLVDICGTPDVGFGALASECVDPPLIDLCPDAMTLLCCLQGLRPELVNPGQYEDFEGDIFGLTSRDPDIFEGSMTYADTDPLPSCAGATLTAKLIGGTTLEVYKEGVLQETVTATETNCNPLEITFPGVQFGSCQSSSIVFKAA